MNKTELIAAIASKTELSKKDAEKALKAFTDVVTEELKKGEKIQLVGFADSLVSLSVEFFPALPYNSLICSEKPFIIKGSFSLRV